MGKNEVVTFSRLFLNQILFILAGKETYIKAYMSLDFGQVPPMTTELAALERLRHTPIDL